MKRSIQVPAHWDSLQQLTDFADAVEHDGLLEQDQLFVLRLVIEEIVTNLIKYGYAEAEIEGLVEVDCATSEGLLTITIRDRGRPFDPRETPDPHLSDDVQERAVGGLGVFLVRELVDEIAYNHDAPSGWNELIIFKHHAPLTVEQFLRNSSLFDGFSDEDLEHLAETAAERVLEPGELLFVEGHSGDDCCVIIDGQLEVYKQLGDEELPLDVRQPGQIVGEMALIDNSPRSASVRAVGQVRVLMLTKENFYTLLTRNPANAIEMLRGGTMRLRSTSERMIAGLQAKNAELLRAYQDLKAAQDELIRLERIEQELQIARRIQEAFLPRQIRQPTGWQIAALSRGAQEIGGDFYDCIDLPGGLLGLVVADVSGKGIPAALFVALTRSLLRAASQSPHAFGMHELPAPEELLRQALQFTNGYIGTEHASSNMFVTLFYGLLDPASGLLQFVNAGHNPPLLLRAASGSVEELDAGELPLGILVEQPFMASSVRIYPGDALIAFSDGITEAMNTAGDVYDDPRLLAVLRAHPGRPAPNLRDAIVESVAAFVGDAPQADDITLLIVSRNVA
jgi:serine phosphatase RsbU (regulator of sigma subunit)/anti-sigma regulatory factor (Ser/Thr protein kinase)